MQPHVIHEFLDGLKSGPQISNISCGEELLGGTVSFFWFCVCVCSSSTLSCTSSSSSFSASLCAHLCLVFVSFSLSLSLCTTVPSQPLSCFVRVSLSSCLRFHLSSWRYAFQCECESAASFARRRGCDSSSGQLQLHRVAGGSDENDAESARHIASTTVA